MAAITRYGLTPLIRPREGSTAPFGHTNNNGPRSGQFYLVNKTPAYCIGPDGLILLVGAPWPIKLGVPV